MSANVTAERLAAMISRVAGLRAEYARADEPFEVDVIPTDVHDLDGYRELEKAGATTCRVVPWRMYPEPPTPEGRLASVRRFAEEVIDRY
jgi:hypothetical protein